MQIILVIALVAFLIAFFVAVHKRFFARFKNVGVLSQKLSDVCAGRVGI